MSEKTVAEKARVKPDARFAVLDAVPGVVESLGLPAGATEVGVGQADLVFIFVETRAALESRLPEAVASLAPAAAIWVFFRKGSKPVGNQINRDDVWAVAEKLGLGPLGLVSVDETWSVFRLRRKP